jgi:SAM-dependent methyltransferase
MKNWYATWFDTPYYHLLYKNRNQMEAGSFIENLLLHLKPSKEALFLDVACGKGRHSKHIHQLGFNVHGIDLSEKSIKEASIFNNERLHFEQHDMREVYISNYFDYTVNLFTSFGYFDDVSDNQKAMDAMAKNLKKDGILVIDFMNAKKVCLNLVEKEMKSVDYIDFYIERKIKSGFIQKDIQFTDKGKKHHFQEKVQALTLNDFSNLLQKAGLKIIDLWGNYEKNDFDVLKSNRLIIIAQK